MISRPLLLQGLAQLHQMQVKNPAHFQRRSRRKKKKKKRQRTAQTDIGSLFEMSSSGASSSAASEERYGFSPSHPARLSSLSCLWSLVLALALVVLPWWP